MERVLTGMVLTNVHVWKDGKDMIVKKVLIFDYHLYYFVEFYFNLMVIFSCANCSHVACSCSEHSTQIVTKYIQKGFKHLSSSSIDNNIVN